MKDNNFLGIKRLNDSKDFEEIFLTKIDFLNKLSNNNNKSILDIMILKNLEMKELINSDPIKILNKNTKLFIFSIKYQIIEIDSIPQDFQLNIFFIACNFLKEMDKQVKLYGLQLIELFYEKINEEYFKNAYIFEKDLIKNYHLATATHKTKKFVSLGDYEVSKVDSNIGINYGYFATALDDEKKEIKIECLKVIRLIGKKYKGFAETSFKYIVEMINDEEDEVRYETIQCLEDLISNFNEMDAKTCEIIYFNLNEKSSRLRKMLYSLLSRIFFQSFKDYKDFIKTILDSLKAFPEDKNNIFDCLKQSLNYNVKFIDLEFITETLNLDKNFLFPEYNWYDINYALKLIIFQEYYKRTKDCITVPSFFIKHFSYFSNKFPKVFEKDFVISQLKNKVIPYQNNVNQVSVQNDIKQFLFNDNILQEKLLIFETKIETMKLHEIYSSFFFFFLKSIKYLLESNNIKESFFILISKFIMISELINLKLEDLNTILSFELSMINDYLIFTVLIKVFTHFKYSHFERVIIEINEHMNKAESVNLIEKNINNIIKGDYTSFEQKILETYSELLDNKLITSNFMTPKNYFQYCCPRYNINFPYLLSVEIKIKNCCKDSNLIRKIQLLLQKKDDKLKEILFNPSDFEYIEKDRLYNLKTKIPLSIKSDEENIYNIFLVFYSKKQKIYNEFLKKMNFELKCDKYKEDKFYIIAERNNFQVIIEN